MLKNYFQTALRHLLRNRLQSFINISGLAVGISAAMLILLYVNSERNYDQHHPDKDRIFRLNSDVELDGNLDHVARNSMAAGPHMQEMFPEVESFVRIFDLGKQTIWYENRMFSEDKACFADSTFFDFFQYDFLYGDKKTALAEPRCMVISNEIAVKYFGSTATALGRMLKFTRNTYKITGVFRKPEQESHLQYRMVGSISSLQPAFVETAMSDYFRMATYTYLKLKPGIQKADLENKFPQFYVVRIAPWIKQNNVTGKLEFHLQALPSIHLNNTLRYDIPGNANPAYIYIFSIVGIFILLVACINYMNLSTARSSKRAKEVGIRMVAGASRSQIVLQFLGEALVVTLVSFVLALGMVEVLLPVFNSLTDKSFSQAALFRSDHLLMFGALILLVSLVAGSYPAFYLTRVQPAAVLKMGTYTPAGNASLAAKLLGPAALRKYLVVAQFSIAIALIIGTLVVYAQLSFMKNKDLGFDKESVLVIEVPNDSAVNGNLPTIRNEFLKRSDISGIASVSNVPGSQTGQLYFIVDQQSGKANKFLGFMWVDAAFFDLMKIEVKGRNFSDANPADQQTAFIINESCARFLGWADPIGKEMENGFGIKGKVIGVVSDFNYASLHNPVEPMVFMFEPVNAGNLLIRLQGKDLTRSVDEILERWKSFDPNHPLETYFMDDNINENYVKETKMLKVFGYFTLLTITISCLGLFGLASYTTEQRTKEIGIRKVLGASVSNISTLVTREFLLLVLLANIIAWPVAWYFMDRWLSGFAFHLAISWQPFLFSAIAAMLISILTVGGLAIRAAAANPVKALRYE